MYTDTLQDAVVYTRYIIYIPRSSRMNPVFAFVFFSPPACSSLRMNRSRTANIILLYNNTYHNFVCVCITCDHYYYTGRVSLYSEKQLLRDDPRGRAEQYRPHPARLSHTGQARTQPTPTTAALPMCIYFLFFHKYPKRNVRYYNSLFVFYHYIPPVEGDSRGFPSFPYRSKLSQVLRARGVFEFVTTRIP